MKRPWMPLYIADYLNKTSHLRAAESGAYLHLIMAYWVNDGLPDDDRQLATIAKVTDREWRAMRPVLVQFFDDGWKHNRIEEELAKARELSNKRKAAAEQRGNKSKAIAGANAGANAGAIAPTLHTSPIDDDDDETPEPLVSSTANRIAEAVAKVCGHDLEFLPPAWLGAPYRVQTWLGQGWPEAIIIASCREQMARKRDGPPDRIQYFEKGIASAIAKQNAPLPEVKIIEAQTVEVRRGTNENLAQTAKRMSGQVVGFGPRPSIFGSPKDGGSVRLLSDGSGE